MATENIVTGKKFRICTDAVNKIYDRISFWTKASDVYNNSDKALETTCGSITGITSSLTSTSTTMAASASAIKQLNDKIADLNSNLNKERNAHMIYQDVFYRINKFTTNGIIESSSYAISAPTIDSDGYLYFSASNGKSAIARTNQKINLTNYDKLYMTWSACNETNGFQLFITNDLNFKGDFSRTPTAVNNSTLATLYELDLSDYTGEYYIVFRSINGRYGKVHSLILIDED